MSKNAEKTKLVIVGVIGAFLSAGHTKIEGKWLSTDLHDATKLIIPLAAFAIYMIWVWVWQIYKPQSGELLQGRRKANKAIKECNKLLANPDLSAEQRQDLIDKRNTLQLGVIDSMAK